MTERERSTMARRKRGAWRLAAALSLALGGLVLPAAPVHAAGSSVQDSSWGSLPQDSSWGSLPQDSDWH